MAPQHDAVGAVNNIYIYIYIYIDGEIPKTSNSTFGNCSGEGKTVQFCYYIINAIHISVLCSTTVLLIKLLNVVFYPFLIALKIMVM